MNVHSLCPATGQIMQCLISCNPTSVPYLCEERHHSTCWVLFSWNPWCYHVIWTVLENDVLCSLSITVISVFNRLFSLIFCSRWMCWSLGIFALCQLLLGLFQISLFVLGQLCQIVWLVFYFIDSFVGLCLYVDYLVLCMWLDDLCCVYCLLSIVCVCSVWWELCVCVCIWPVCEYCLYLCVCFVCNEVRVWVLVDDVCVCVAFLLQEAVAGPRPPRTDSPGCRLIWRGSTASRPSPLRAPSIPMTGSPSTPFSMVTALMPGHPTLWKEGTR